MRCLALNASFEPLTMVPLRRALRLVIEGKAEIVEADERGFNAGGAVRARGSRRGTNRESVASALTDGRRRLWIARAAGGGIVGTVQLDLAGQTNGRHRAEVIKLMVLGSARRQGIGRLLMEAAREWRRQTQPLAEPNCGSVFKNPEHELSAGRMLEACGLKGHKIGGAQISPRHANFIENADGARSVDAIALMTRAIAALEAMRFTHVPDPSAERTYVAVAAGSGITPSPTSATSGTSTLASTSA